MTPTPGRSFARRAHLAALALLGALALPATALAAGPTVDPGSYDFGPVAIGTTDHLHTFTVTNPGAATLTVTGVSFGSIPGFYGDWTDCANNGTLAPGGSCTFVIQFAPQPFDPMMFPDGGPGAKSTNGIVYWSDASGAHNSSVPLSGFAIDPSDPAIRVDPPSHDFGSRGLGTHTGQTFTVDNPGGAALHISSVAAANAGGQFGIAADGSDHCTGATVAAGASCTFTAEFVPSNTTTGAKTGQVVVTSDAANGAATIAVQGIVLVPAPVVPAPVVPAPVVPAPVVPAPVVPAPVVPAPVVPAPVAPGATDIAAPDATTLSVVVARTSTVRRNRIRVGCRLNAGRLASCTVTASVAGHAVGRGTATFTGRRGTVQVRLTARGRRLVHRAGGVKLTYRATATTTTGKRLTSTSSSRLRRSR